MSLWTSIPQQRRYTRFDITSSCRRRRGTLEESGLSLAGLPPCGRSLNRKFPKRAPAIFTHGLVDARTEPVHTASAHLPRIFPPAPVFIPVGTEA